MNLPTLHTQRLTLRPPTMDDAPAVHKYVSDRDVALVTRSIPHPYEPGMAEQFLRSRPEVWEKGEAIELAIVPHGQTELIGLTGLLIKRSDDVAELGYWLGKPHWGHGYCTEAARALVHEGLRNQGLHRIYATCMTINPASARVLEKIGMKYEGTHRAYLKKWGEYRDAHCYAILSTDL